MRATTLLILALPPSRLARGWKHQASKRPKRHAPPSWGGTLSWLLKKLYLIARLPITPDFILSKNAKGRKKTDVMKEIQVSRKDNDFDKVARTNQAQMETIPPCENTDCLLV
ncbi:hypothetical protein NDU88_005010 [Pleurodeles waltl]|uniref:Secreted protein n=1 Tax=Pleurodeles waltl TaxID=8319 RepID=A0AAV7L1V5_PLEWA|nr:hypothetical protein NDU88_005010 [Pleurodeles waltl]